MRFVIFGAGAVGGVIGGHLALDKHAVRLVCREDHATAIRSQGGLKMKSATGEYFAALDATPTIDVSSFDPETVVFLCSKSNDTRACVETIARHAPADVPVVCFQNGIGNEAIAAERLSHVFGGVCRMTCSYLHPGQVSYRKSGRLVVGRYPKGAHTDAKRFGAALTSAGFTTSVSKDIMADKWLKLVLNLHSAVHAVIDERDHDTRAFIDIKIALLEEAKRTLKAAKIKAKSCDGKDHSIDEMIDALKKPRTPRHESGVRVHNSTWQSLYKKRDVIENAAFHGPIIEMGREHGIITPYNDVVLEIVTRSARDRMGPGQFRAAGVMQMAKDRSATA